MVKAIIFDCFGVLTTEGWLPFKNKYFGQDQERHREASQIIGQANTGQIAYADFIKQVAALADITPAEVQHSIRQNVVNEPLFDYIKQLKPIYKIGFLSNIAGNHLGELFSPEQLSLFDAISLSYKTGVVKPDAKAFTIITDQLQIGLEEAVLIDDQEINVVGAHHAGLQAILYRDNERLQRELNQLLGASANPKS